MVYRSEPVLYTDLVSCNNSDQLVVDYREQAKGILSRTSETLWARLVRKHVLVIQAERLTAHHPDLATQAWVEAAEEIYSPVL